MNSNVVKKGKNDSDRTSGDCISRQAAKDIFTELYGISAIGSVFDKYEWADICETTANELPSAQPAQSYTIHSDGRLWVTVDDIDKVNAVVVDESKSKFCKQFYIDVQPDTTTHDSMPAENGRNDSDRTSGDCISRTQAIDTIKEIYEWHDSVTKERIIEHFKQLPSVQPERLKGKWIHQAKFSRIECDQCGKVFRNTFAPKNFCPNCGADMKGEQE